MPAVRFAQPVSIFVGIGFPRDVETLTEAFQVLNEWTGARGPMHTTALNVCLAALAGQAETETARLAFEAFARARGMLAPDALADAAMLAASDWIAV
ncbi:Protein of unknown function [Mesorhizobium albiziae]|uniref:DUF982 domain-containing protein n=1 Tax=Neomesorhizobium albiziae TaxID=335020 RepID=A0A1I4DW70_9HYPH|nr:DUF982 domain-containing protein [Mesorhizobium albiziae]GLS33737.1 hypothetical protein GCM10007937_54490 [Mesorhizobium albiziae]SFK96151.1 Protein of unknown function [Mesorhizobium albiziae]